MSTLSQRLERLRRSGKLPQAGESSGETHPGTTAGGADTQEPDGSRTSRADRAVRLRREAAAGADASAGASAGAGAAAGATAGFGPAAGGDRAAPLRRREGHGPAVSAKPQAAIRPETRPPGEGWEFRSDFLWERSLDYPDPLPDSFDSPFLLPEDTAPGDAVFYDLETTGLSGGAGNVAFLIGLGFRTGGVFRVVQLFLSDYPGEEALLRRYAVLAGEGRPQVSYNGRSFDSQVLKTRFLLNRMPPPGLLQVDLLYPSRRLWKGILPDLTLRRLETDVLDFHRTDDLPGREAPEAWFEWLDGNPGRIDGVFRHNADDIVSLARLLDRIEAWGRRHPGTAGEPPSGTPPSCWGLSRQWMLRDVTAARRWLEEGERRGERRCALELARLCRKEGDFENARAVWEKLKAGGRDVAASVELAKYWEHRRKDPSRALEVLSGLDPLNLDDRRRKELDHRSRRLKRKIDKL